MDRLPESKGINLLVKGHCFSLPEFLLESLLGLVHFSDKLVPLFWPSLLSESYVVFCQSESKAQDRAPRQGHLGAATGSEVFFSAWAVGFGCGHVFSGSKKVRMGSDGVSLDICVFVFFFGVLGSVYTCAFWKLSSGRIAHFRVDVTIQTLFASMASPTRDHPQLWRFTGPCLGFRQEAPFADLLVIAEWGNPLSNSRT